MSWDDDGVQAAVGPKPESIRQVQASHDLQRVSVTFDDDTLLPNGGLAVAALLAQRLGVADLVDEHVAVSALAPMAAPRPPTVVGAALAGGDCIGDTDVLWADRQGSYRQP